MPTFLVRFMYMALARLPRGSYLRRRIQKRNFRRAFEALARDDYEFALLAYEQDVELRVWAMRPALSAWPRPTTDIRDSATFSATTNRT